MIVLVEVICCMFLPMYLGVIYSLRVVHCSNPQYIYTYSPMGMDFYQGIWGVPVAVRLVTNAYYWHFYNLQDVDIDTILLLWDKASMGETALKLGYLIPIVMPLVCTLFYYLRVNEPDMKGRVNKKPEDKSGLPYMNALRSVLPGHMADAMPKGVEIDDLNLLEEHVYRTELWCRELTTCFGLLCEPEVLLALEKDFFKLYVKRYSKVQPEEKVEELVIAADVMRDIMSMLRRIVEDGDAKQGSIQNIAVWKLSQGLASTLYVVQAIQALGGKKAAKMSKPLVNTLNQRILQLTAEVKQLQVEKPGRQRKKLPKGKP